MDELTHPEQYQPITKGPVVAVLILAVLAPFILANAIIRFIAGKSDHD